MWCFYRNTVHAAKVIDVQDCLEAVLRCLHSLFKRKVVELTESLF